MSFHDLHHQGVPFVLPNAWDVPSALAYLADGFTAIGTTSFGVASSGGRRTDSHCHRPHLKVSCKDVLFIMRTARAQRN